MRISSSSPSIANIAQPPTTPAPEEKSEDFGKMLMDAMKEVNASQNDSTKLQQSFMAGQPVEYHDLMIAMERANTTMQLTLQVRNKLLDAYQEISRMQV